MKIFTYPMKSEYPEYFETYIGLVKGEEDILSYLELHAKEVLHIIEGLDDSFMNETYKIGKWTIKELMIHLIDTERIFCTRALHIARGEQKILPGYDHDEYVRKADAFGRTKESLLEEYIANRISTLAFFKGLSKNAHETMGVANGLRISVRSLLYAVAGHEKHHISILKERYL